jgi:hypothetical protein
VNFFEEFNNKVHVISDLVIVKIISSTNHEEKIITKYHIIFQLQKIHDITLIMNVNNITLSKNLIIKHIILIFIIL